MPFEEPGFVVWIAEFQQGLPELLDGFEDPNPEQVLLRGADGPFGAPVREGASRWRVRKTS